MIIKSNNIIIFDDSEELEHQDISNESGELVIDFDYDNTEN